MRISILGWCGFSLVIGAALLACADESFAVHHASDFPKGGTSLSVFGVFKDGRMSAESWDQLGPRLTAPFAGGPCEVAYGERLTSGAPALASAVDDYARANGVTDDLLDQFAPMAKGDAILLITVAGHPPQPIGDGGAPAAQPARAPSMRGGGRRGRGQMPSSSSDSARATDRSVLEVSASLFSVKLHRSVAIVAMAYSGASVDEALKKFARKLEVEMPGSTCTGWRWEAPPDDAPIHKMLEE